MSYTNSVKQLIASKKERKKCCKRAFYSGRAEQRADYNCENCCKAFIRGLFLACGNISDPKNAYHLEFAVTDEKFALEIQAVLNDAGIFLKFIKRRKNHVLYLKSSEQIEDFLYYLDVPKISFDLMETKILKDFRNNANRVTNFENANLEKISNASAEQIDAIKFIIEKGGFDSLPDELKQTASLRLENIEMSISEIGEISNPPVSKSGIKHRMQRIINIAKDLGERK